MYELIAIGTYKKYVYAAPRVHNKEKRVSNVHSALYKIIPENHALGMFIKCGRWRQEKTNRVIFCTLHSYSEIASVSA